MRIITFIIAFFALPLSAQLRFVPPNPTSRTPVTMHFSGQWQGCWGYDGIVTRSGSSIDIGIDFTHCPGVERDLTIDLGLLPAGVYDVSVGIAPSGGPNDGTPLVGLGRAELPIADANAPFTVSPNVAPHDADVTITGLSLPACRAGSCAAPLVTFGGSEAAIVEFAPPDRLVVHAPSRRPGTVDVVVTYAGNTYTAAAAFNYFAGLDALDPPFFDPAFFEPVLFPVMLSGPGAFGSSWSTDVTLRNENAYTLPVQSIFDQLVPGLDVRPPAHSTRTVSGANVPNGYLLNIPRQAAPKLFFGTLIRDLSRQSEALGAQIPVVRENDFFDRPFTLLNVPADSRYRVSVRFYRIDGGVTLHYRIHPLSTDETLVDTFAFLAPSSQGSTLNVAFIGDLLTTYPQLAGKGPLRIDIDGTPAQRASWAFVSVTNNSTQHVTVISPQ